MDKRVIRQWRKMLVRGLITPSEHMLFRRIAVLERDNARLKKNTTVDGDNPTTIVERTEHQ
jgi:hypothetical protein